MNRTSKWEMWKLRYNVLVADTGNSQIFLYSPQSFVSHVHRFLTNMFGLVDLETPIFFLKLVPTLVVFPPVSLIMCEYFLYRYFTSMNTLYTNTSNTLYTDTSHLFFSKCEICECCCKFLLCNFCLFSTYSMSIYANNMNKRLTFLNRSEYVVSFLHRYLEEW